MYSVKYLALATLMLFTPLFSHASVLDDLARQVAVLTEQVQKLRNFYSAQNGTRLDVISNTDTTSGSLVTPKPVNQPPVIASVDSSAMIAASFPTTIAVQASDPEHGSLTYRIWWGDGLQQPSPSATTTQTEPTFVHVYPTVGKYMLTVEVYDAEKHVSRMQKIITVIQAKTYTNPLSTSSCSDLNVFYDDVTKTYYMACTGAGFGIRTSTDGVTWTPSGRSIFTNGIGPTWSNNVLSQYVRNKKNWAPEIAKVDANYLAYVTVNSPENDGGKLDGCGAIAVYMATTSVLGPYHDALITARTPGGAPLVQKRCDVVGGVIDATYFKDASTGAQYLAYKYDGNAIGSSTPIVIRELATDGIHFKAGSVEHRLITGGPKDETKYEAMSLFKHDDYYYLLYSNGTFASTYKINVARSKVVDGKYTLKSDPVILQAKPDLTGKFFAPGTADYFRFGDKEYLYYSAKVTDGTDARMPMLEPIVWQEGWPMIGNGYPSENPVLAPLQ